MQKEKEDIVKQLPEVLKNNRDEPLSQSDMTNSCLYLKDSKIVLYGVGKFGRIYYQWIKEHHQGNSVGWVDNLWYIIKDIDYPITLVDSLLTINYDYILIAIKSKQIQEEVTQNLICWGIPKEKICLISTNEL